MTCICHKYLVFRYIGKLKGVSHVDLIVRDPLLDDVVNDANFGTIPPPLVRIKNTLMFVAVSMSERRCVCDTIRSPLK